MKNLLLSLLFISCLALSCAQNNQKAEEEITPDTPAVEAENTKIPPKIITDTMQFIHFDANGDYWFALFLNSKRDTVRLLTDKEFKPEQLGKLMEVKWHRDSLSLPSEDEKKYAAKRLESFRIVDGKPFAAPATEFRALADVKSLVEVKENADRVWVAAKPEFDKPYYQVESETVNEDNNSRLFSFRVYTYPKYEIKVMDWTNDRELSLADWRKNNQ